MIRLFSPRHAAILALTCGALAAGEGTARAAFTIAINGTTVATDGGVGDTNATNGVIDFAGTVSGYSLQFTIRTDLSSPTIGDLTASQLLIRNVSGSGSLTVTLTESAFNVPAGALGDSVLFSSLARNLSAGRGTSGTVSLTSTATSATGGGTATTTPLVIDTALGALSTSTTFNRTSAVYSLTTTIDVSGLNTSDAVVLTGDGAVSGGTLAPVPTPAPAGAVMLLSGLPFLGLCVRRRRA